jgi:hypothetical protein
MKRTLFVVALASATVLLTGCFPSAGSGTATGAATASTPTPTLATATAAPSPSPSAAPAAGDCAATDGGPGRQIPVVYTVYGPNATDPVTVTFTSFNRDGSLPPTTATFTGPVFTRVGFACTDAAGAANWTLTATSTTTGKVGCVLAFGGMLVKTASAYLESATPGATTANCTGNPGR